MEEKGVTHAEHQALLNQARKSSHAAGCIFAGAAAPEHTGLLIGRDVDGLEGDTVGAEDRLETGGRGDNVRGAGGQGGEDPEGWIGRESRRGCHDSVFFFDAGRGCGGRWVVAGKSFWEGGPAAGKLRGPDQSAKEMSPDHGDGRWKERICNGMGKNLALRAYLGFGYLWDCVL